MTAKIITVFNAKGGCGKTTTSMHIAGTAALRGMKSLIIDMDTQGTATKWHREAPDDDEFPARITNLSDLGGKIHREIRHYVSEYDMIVIDCPPAIDSPAPSSAMLVSDLAIIPVIPSPADIWAAKAAQRLTDQIISQNESLIVRMLVNRMQKTNLISAMLDELAETDGVVLLRSRLGARSAFCECQLSGSTVHGVPGAKKAIEEVDALFNEIVELIGK